MASKPPNIIVIVMDTAGAKHMSLYGYHRQTTPQLERLADRATVYTRCFAPASWTLPSHASLFTGLYPSEHGVEGVVPEKLVLSPNFQHVGAILKQAGYVNYSICCNPLISRAYNIIRDCDIFIEYCKGGSPKSGIDKLVNNNKLVNIFNKGFNRVMMNAEINFLRLMLFRHFRQDIFKYSAPFTEKSFKTAEDITTKHGISNKEKPFFMFMNLIENHSMYNPPKAGRQFSRNSDNHPINYILLYCDDYAFLRNRLPVSLNLYDDTVLFMDSLIGNFMNYLDSSGLLDNTIVMITSDHGEHFGENGFYEHGFSLHNELIHLPLIVSYPNGCRPVGTDGRLASLNDLFGTILDLIESPFPCPRSSLSLLSSVKRSGVSSMNLDIDAHKAKLATHFLRKPKEWAETLTAHSYALVLDNHLKLLQKDDGSLAIYNLSKDPHEEHDLAASMVPELRQELFKLLLADQEETGYLNWIPQVAN